MSVGLAGKSPPLGKTVWWLNHAEHYGSLAARLSSLMVCEASCSTFLLSLALMLTCTPALLSPTRAFSSWPPILRWTATLSWSFSRSRFSFSSREPGTALSTAPSIAFEFFSPASSSLWSTWQKVRSTSSNLVRIAPTCTSSLGTCPLQSSPMTSKLNVSLLSSGHWATTVWRSWRQRRRLELSFATISSGQSRRRVFSFWNLPRESNWWRCGFTSPTNLGSATYLAHSCTIFPCYTSMEF